MNKDSKTNWLLRRAPATIAGVILLGLVCTTIYDLALKPGLSATGRFFLNIFTLGSQKVIDSAYESAALDPTPIASLMLILVAILIAITPSIIIISELLPWSTKAKKQDILLERLEEADGEEAEKIVEDLERLKNRGRYFRIPFAIISFAVFIPFLVHNQSVVIWRVFNANVRIIRPHISENEYNILLSDFSSVKTKEDYEKVETKIKEHAAKSSLPLQNIETW